MTSELEYLEQVRRNLRMTTVEFTGFLPLHRTTYYGWLKGRTPDKLRLALCLARAKRLIAERQKSNG